MIAYSCSTCQKKLSVKPELAGKRVKCPGCGQVTLVPALVPANADLVTIPPSLDAEASPAAAPDQKQFAIGKEGRVILLPLRVNNRDTATDPPPDSVGARCTTSTKPRRDR